MFVFFFILDSSLRYCHYGNTSNLYPADPPWGDNSSTVFPWPSLDPSRYVDEKDKSFARDDGKLHWRKKHVKEVANYMQLYTD